MHASGGDQAVGAARREQGGETADGVDGLTPLHLAADKGHGEAITVLVQLGVNKDAKGDGGETPLHFAAFYGHVEAIKLLVEMGVQADVQDVHRETALHVTIRAGHHQAAQLLRQLERAVRTQKEAETSERAQQAAEQADRNAAALIEEEEREEAAKVQSKVRGVELAPVRGVSDAVSLAHGWVASSEVPADVFRRR